MNLTRQQWAMVSNMLRFAGFVCCMVLFVTPLILLAHYEISRPHVPMPEKGWTVRLDENLALPTYGTASELNRIKSMHWWFFPPFLLIAAGYTIRLYKLNIYDLRTPDKTLYP